MGRHRHGCNQTVTPAAPDEGAAGLVWRCMDEPQEDANVSNKQGIGYFATGNGDTGHPGNGAAIFVTGQWLSTRGRLRPKPGALETICKVQTTRHVGRRHGCRFCFPHQMPWVFELQPARRPPVPPQGFTPPDGHTAIDAAQRKPRSTAKAFHGSPRISSDTDPSVVGYCLEFHISARRMNTDGSRSQSA